MRGTDGSRRYTEQEANIRDRLANIFTQASVLCAALGDIDLSRDLEHDSELQRKESRRIRDELLFQVEEEA